MSTQIENRKSFIITVQCIVIKLHNSNLQTNDVIKHQHSTPYYKHTSQGWKNA